MTKRVLISVAVFGPIYAYLAFSWTGCLDGSCSPDSASNTAVAALTAFVLILLLVGLGSAIAGSKNLREAAASKQADKAALGGIDLWLGFQLLLLAIGGGVAAFKLL